MNYLEKLTKSGIATVEAIKNDPFERKLFNFIKNDLSGIINRFNDERITFEFNDTLIDKHFMDSIISILKECQFHEERYDKRVLRERLTELFTTMVDTENFVVGNKELQNAFWFPLCDREFKFLLYIKNNYD